MVFSVVWFGVHESAAFGVGHPVEALSDVR
jgi:hypothetical protein